MLDFLSPSLYIGLLDYHGFMGLPFPHMFLFPSYWVVVVVGGGGVRCAKMDTDQYLALESEHLFHVSGGFTERL